MASDERPDPKSIFFTKFLLYKTRSNFYMIGKDETRNYWKVLKIDRLELSELNIFEDSTMYTEAECHDLLGRINLGNKLTGGLRLVTLCFGIVGFIRFLGPYYMLVITKRRELGTICGHPIYAIEKSEMFRIPSSSLRFNMANSKNERRYEKLMSSVNLARQFFFSYSYNVMHSLQKNLTDHQNRKLQKGKSLYKTTFVWNHFLTRGIRSRVESTMWTVALVYGFFEQIQIPVPDRDVKLILIARRSRQFAGTRYHRRGINLKGRVANYVETEQIVFEDVPERCAVQISSVVQNRGSIPLFWSQEISRFSIRPEIRLSDQVPMYEATRLHFENLIERYGKPIIVWDLTKTHEKSRRETKLRRRYVDAIKYINESLNEENQIQFFNCDLSRLARTNAALVMERLSRLARDALKSTGIFYSQLSPDLGPQADLNTSSHVESNGRICAEGENVYYPGATSTSDSSAAKNLEKTPMFQKGILRTNCIDCLDRTNNAQYAYGLAALGLQLYVLGLTDSADIELDTPLVRKLMEIYESMGNELALQYGGSPAHNKIFCELRGEPRLDTKSTEVMINLQRFFSNIYLDAEKQDAINLFLGHFQPQEGRPALWELDSDQHSAVGRGASFGSEIPRSVLRRSFSEGNLLRDGDITVQTSLAAVNQNWNDLDGLPEDPQPHNDDIYDSSFLGPRQVTQTSHIFVRQSIFNEKRWGQITSNFGMDWLNSAENSSADDISVAALLSRHLTSDIEISPGNSVYESGSCLEGIRATWFRGFCP